jgi:hypothetical protein
MKTCILTRFPGPLYGNSSLGSTSQSSVPWPQLQGKREVGNACLVQGNNGGPSILCLPQLGTLVLAQNY